MLSRLYRFHIILLSFFLCVQALAYDVLKTEKESFQIFVKDTIDHLSNNTFNLLSSDQDGMILSKFGFKVENACFDKLGVDFLDTLKETMVEGLQCLTRISNQNISSNITGSLKNAFNLANLVRMEDNIMLMCSRDNLGANIQAEATAGEYHYSLVEERMVLLDLFISLNLTSNPFLIQSQESDQAYFKEVLFHELMHTLGSLHESGIEYAYSCGTCCFSSQDNKKKELACKICNGNYKSEVGLEYLKDLLDYAMESNDRERNLLRRNVIGRIQFNYPKGPEDFSGQILLARSYLSSQHSIGLYLGKIIKESQDKLTAKQMADLVNIEEFYQRFVMASHIKALSSIIANAFSEFYHNEDTGRAFAILEKHKYEIAYHLQVERQWGSAGQIKNIKNILKKFMKEIFGTDIILKTNTISEAAYVELKTLFK